MGGLTSVAPLVHSRLMGTRVYPLDPDLKAGTPQEVLVDLPPGAELPMHKHGVDAAMFIVGGSGVVLSDDREIDGRSVSIGDVIRFEREIMHGFRASDAGLTFLSRNGGIVADEQSQWEITFRR